MCKRRLRRSLVPVSNVKERSIEMSVLTVLVAVAIVAFVIYKQVVGAPLTGKRAIALPAVLAIIGIVELSGSRTHMTALDLTLLVVSGAISVAVGLGLGAMTRVESRDGRLWTQLPKRGLWLWGGLILSRLLMVGLADALGAHAVAGSSAILLTLGLNRIAQALVVVPRAVAAGIPFAPEKDGRIFLEGLFVAR
jgi:hypothetical protein